MSGVDLFDDPFMVRLQRLSIAARRAPTLQAIGTHRSAMKGLGIEFEEFRTYAPGDDLRYVDWNVYSRLDTLVTKQFRENRRLHLALFIDRSGSMDSGASNKFTAALRLAAALGTIALANFDKVSIHPFGDRLDPPRFLVGKQMGHELFRFLGAIRPGGKTDLSTALADRLHRVRGKGIAVILSDFLDPTGGRAALQRLKLQRYQVHLLQVDDQTEREPELTGPVQLTDAETGETLTTDLTPEMLRRYRDAYQKRCTRLADYCLHHEFGYARIDSAAPFDSVVLPLLQRGGLLA